MLPRTSSSVQDAPQDVASAFAALRDLATLGESIDQSDGPTLLPTPDGQSLAQAQYRSLIEHIPAVTFLASLAGGRNQLYVSPQIESLLGFSQTEWLSDPILWYRQTHPDDRARVSTLFAESCATGRPFSDVFRVLTRSGETVWVHAQAHFVRDARGQLSFLQGVGFDVTAQHRAREAREQLIREQAARAEADRERDRLRDIFMHLPAAVALVRGDAHVVEFMNPVALALSEAGSDAVGQPFAAAFPDLGRHLSTVLETARSSTESIAVRELGVCSQRWPEERFFDVVCQRIAFSNEELLLVRDEMSKQRCICATSFCQLPRTSCGRQSRRLQARRSSPNDVCNAASNWSRIGLNKGCLRSCARRASSRSLSRNCWISRAWITVSWQSSADGAISRTWSGRWSSVLDR
jgi:PAS domain S-box-containing protein